LTLEHEMSDVTGNSPLAMAGIRKGRPPKPNPLTAAERTSRARDKKKQQGFSELKCHVDQVTRANLEAVCAAENCTISEAISRALQSAVRYGLAPH
jgi:DNA-binding Xre family transcriptional regulator